jgi:coatomer subunit beta
VHQDNAADVPAQNELKNALEKGSDEQKIETMVRSCNCICPASSNATV